MLIRRSTASGSSRGFTLLELITVLVLLGILGSITVFTFGDAVFGSKDKLVLAEAAKLDQAFRTEALALNNPGSVDPTTASRLGPNAPSRIAANAPSAAAEVQGTVVIAPDFEDTGHVSITLNDVTACLTVGATAGEVGEVAPLTIEGTGPCVGIGNAAGNFPY